MPSKKIDPKKIVSDVFGGAPSGTPAEDEVWMASLAGKGGGPAAPKRQPPKKFVWHAFKNEFAGIDIGTDSIKFVLLGYEHKRAVLKDVQVEKMIQPAEEGRPEEREKEILNGLVKIASRVKAKMKVGIALNDPRLYSDILSVPRGPEEEVRQSVQTQMCEKHLIEPAANFFDYVSFNGSGELEPAQDVFAVAAPRDLVYKQFELVQSAGFKVLAVETNALASIPAIKRVGMWDRGERVLILDVGAQMSVLSILVGERLVFSRVIPIAGERFTKSVQNEFGVNVDAAEGIKLKYGLKAIVEDRAAPAGTDETRSDAQRAADALRSDVERLIGEVERSCHFAVAKELGDAGQRISKIFLAGGSARLLYFKDFVADRLEAPVTQIDLWSGLAIDEQLVDRSFLEGAQDLAAVSLGLALRVCDWKALPFGWGMPG